MNLITKLPPRAYMQRVRRNRGIYCDVNAPKCTSESSFPSLCQGLLKGEGDDQFKWIRVWNLCCSI